MSDVTVTTRIKIETPKMIATEVWPDDVHICVKQSGAMILFDPAALSAYEEARK